MLYSLIGSIFDSTAGVLVNPVNTKGVSGAGLALEFKKRFPRCTKRYEELCKTGQFKIGTLLLLNEMDLAQREAEAEERSLTEEERAAIIPQKVLYFPTKDEWRFPSKMEYIEAGLDKFAKSYENKKILSACFPMLGCGCGKLKWDEVYQLMYKYLNPILCQCVVVHADANGKPFTFPDEIGGAAS